MKIICQPYYTCHALASRELIGPETSRPPEGNAVI
jgi:hypothetical protein